MYSEKQLLYLAGQLALTAQQVLNSDARSFGFYINEMEKALNEYNKAIFENIEEKLKV